MSQIQEVLHPSPLTNAPRCYMQQDSGNNNNCIQRQAKTTVYHFRCQSNHLKKFLFFLLFAKGIHTSLIIQLNGIQSSMKRLQFLSQSKISLFLSNFIQHHIHESPVMEPILRKFSLANTFMRYSGRSISVLFCH
jgi:hypothetical protein